VDRHQIVLAAVAVAFVAIAAACATPDPEARVLERRGLWDVELLSTVIREDGSALANFRLSGPVNRELDDLTIRIDLLDQDRRVIRSVWHAFDLRDISRGTPTEKIVALPAIDPAPEGVTFDRVLRPTESDRGQIVELRDLPRQ